MFERAKGKKANLLKQELEKLNIQIESNLNYPKIDGVYFLELFESHFNIFENMFAYKFKKWLLKVENHYSQYHNQKKDYLKEAVIQSESDFLRKYFIIYEKELYSFFKKFEESFKIKAFLKEGRHFLRSIVKAFREDHLIHKSHDHFHKLKEEYEAAYKTLKKSQSDFEVHSVIHRYYEVEQACHSFLEFFKEIMRKPLTKNISEEVINHSKKLDSDMKNFSASLKKSKSEIYDFLKALEACFKAYASFQLNNYAYVNAENTLEKLHPENGFVLAKEFYTTILSEYDQFIKRKILLIRNLEVAMLHVPGWEDQVERFKKSLVSLGNDLSSSEKKIRFTFSDEFYRLSSKIIAEGYHKNDQKLIMTGAKLRTVGYPRFMSGPYDDNMIVNVVSNSENLTLMHGVSVGKPGWDGSWNSGNGQTMSPEEYANLLEKILKGGLKPSERSDTPFPNDSELRDLREVWFFLFNKSQVNSYGPCSVLSKPGNDYALFKGVHNQSREFFILSKVNIPVIKGVYISRSWAPNRVFPHTKMTGEEFVRQLEELLKKKGIPFKEL